MSTFLSIIIVTHQAKDGLEKTVKAALAASDQTEIVVVDNGNAPELVARFEAWAKAVPRVKWLSGHGNVGFSAGCNLGATAAEGDFLLFLNPDCLLSPDHVARLAGYAATIKRPFMIGARLVDGKGREQPTCRRALTTPLTVFIEMFGLYKYFPTQKLQLHKTPVPKALTTIPAISGASMFLAAEDFWNVDGFNEAYFAPMADMDFCLRFSRAGGTIYYAPDLVLIHTGSGAASLAMEKHRTRARIRYFHENFGHEYPQPALWAVDTVFWVRYGWKALWARAKK